MDLVSFVIKTIVVAAAVSVPVILVTLAAFKKASKDENEDKSLCIDIKDLKQDMLDTRERMQDFLDSHDPKKLLDAKNPQKGKKEKGKDKKKALEKKKQEHEKALKERQEYVQALKQKEEQGIFCPRHLFVINFKGGARALEVSRLRKKIDVILSCATKDDEVVVRLSSPGGVVNGYGLLSSQLQRIKDKGICLTCCVDAVAASGGYLMAAIADKIVAAPFAYIGSIGVVAALPNFNRLLTEHHIDYEQITAGRYKRTLTMLGPNDEEGRAKFKEELELIHKRFQEVVKKNRPQVDLDKVATGEHWLAVDALQLGLVDEISTSDEYIAKRAFETYECVLQIKCTRQRKPKLMARLRDLMKLKSMAGQSVPDAIIDKMNESAYSQIR